MQSPSQDFVLFSRVLGKRVFDTNHRCIGKIIDLVVTSEQDFPPVLTLEFKGKGKVLSVPWSQIAEFEPTCTLRVTQDHLSSYQVREGDLLLRQDLLDKQIVDMEGHRVVRVNDLTLAFSSGSLRLVGVDAGARGILRRLNLEKFGEAVARLFRFTLHSHFLSWSEVELIQSGPGRIKLKLPTARLARLHPVDIADIIHQLEPAERTEVFEQLDLETAADALAEVEPEVQTSIIESLDEERAADILEEMGPDEAADLLADLSEEKSQELLEEMEADEAADAKELLAYDETTAGGLMTTEYVALSAHVSADQAIVELRRQAREAETISYVYVIDETEHLVGVISLRDLILSEPSTLVSDFMIPEVICVQTGDSADDVAQAIARYDLLALPVVNEENQLQGIVTYDDVVDLIVPEKWTRRLPRLQRARRGKKLERKGQEQ